jgi:hypothetical protein
MPGAEVTLPDLFMMVLTDERGRFQIIGIPPGTHRVVVRHAGYTPFDAQVEFSPMQRVQRQIVLRRVARPD